MMKDCSRSYRKIHYLFVSVSTASPLFLIFRFIVLILFYASCAWMVFAGSRRWNQIPWTWAYGWLALGIEPRLSPRA